ncbi:hypothetical protein CHS0354_020271 [Potamilus streckersoni]|uniref:SWIM-type domain-containing protein n=1 Tax=Potamilus streckersoni TaxID=2493646 RepID=A0AAE0VQW6_9BIVA|nr:hypothetical protein CHS0354_020271 [Potamilus streckersoni]
MIVCLVVIHKTFKSVFFYYSKHIGVKQVEIAVKAIFSAEVLAYMKLKFYGVILMLNSVGNIIHASCSCQDGSDPDCTCRHTAAPCYALEYFVKVFVLPKNIPSCTDKLEASNKPKQVQFPSTPIYDIDFTRKQNQPLKGEQPDAYKPNKICDTMRDFAESFLCELEQ